jgi:hypothetical protein
VTKSNAFPSACALLMANGYSADEAAEIVLFARTKASPGPWIEVLAGVAAARARFKQALGLACPLTHSKAP